MPAVQACLPRTWLRAATMPMPYLPMPCPSHVQLHVPYAPLHTGRLTCNHTHVARHAEGACEMSRVRVCNDTHVARHAEGACMSHAHLARSSLAQSS
eukprot:75781-Chlamydomonas_euryale.AAC.2